MTPHAGPHLPGPKVEQRVTRLAISHALGIVLSPRRRQGRAVALVVPVAVVVAVVVAIAASIDAL